MSITKAFGILIFLAFAFNGFSQNIDSLRAATLNEAILLYRLELASWHSTDVLMAKAKEKLNEMNGYASYVEGKNTRAIFWNADNKIVFTVTFDSLASPRNGIVDRDIRNATDFEIDLIGLRNAAYNLLVNNKDKFFSFYENTHPNLVPLLTKTERVVFILTGATQNELLVGNDYKLVFDQKYTVVKKLKLHNSLIRLSGESDDKVEGSVHTHILDDQPLMTSTDICTFLLYKDIVKMTKHTVVSKKWISIFHADGANLIVVPAPKN
jgi:hypothetical protein